MTILLSLLSLVSASIGHSIIMVTDEWKEELILWTMICLKTGYNCHYNIVFNNENTFKKLIKIIPILFFLGRGKTALYNFIKEIANEIFKEAEKAKFNRERKGRNFLLPNSTWVYIILFETLNYFLNICNYLYLTLINISKG